jgi:hypothetical protein
LCTFLHSPVSSSLLGPNIRLRTLFSNTLSLCSSENEGECWLNLINKQGRTVMLKYSSCSLQIKLNLRNTADALHPLHQNLLLRVGRSLKGLCICKKTSKVGNNCPVLLYYDGRSSLNFAMFCSIRFLSKIALTSTPRLGTLTWPCPSLQLTS